jgi:hypothetical protein
VTPTIKREMRRRSAIEPVIGHLKNEHRMDRNYLAYRHGDVNNAILAAVGYNFRRLIRWLRILIVPYPHRALPAAKTVARLKRRFFADGSFGQPSGAGDGVATSPRRVAGGGHRHGRPERGRD